ncbi:MAG: ribonuclease P protein component [Immundisolibacterales bacterium]|nr:ribonuclease P protein component [Immundisolibacterales bacterium]
MRVGASSRRGAPRAGCAWLREPLTLDLDRSFGRERRLRTRRDFQRVFEAPVRSSGRYFSVLARVRCIGHARLGLAVAKKRVRRANRRNRLKRLVRESFRENQNRLAGMDLVVVAFAAADRERGAVLRSALERQWATLAEECRLR